MRQDVRAACATVIALAVGVSSAHGQDISHPAKVMADGRTWTTSNLDVTNVTSFCYGDDQANCRRYGRLYTWETARQVCQSLGTGWRLPTDADWRRLAQHHGGGSGDDGRLGSEAYDALLTGGRSGFDAVLGGGRSGQGEYARGDAHGFYWTATERGPATAIFYNFGKGSRGLYRQMEGEKDEAFAVRCVKD
jgi:uncharacterized protein (TIGR02145 family)